MGATNQPVEKGEGRHEAAPARHEAAPLVTLDDMRAHQSGGAGKGNEGALHQQGGLNVETNSLYPEQKTGGKAKVDETSRETSEETKRKIELAQKTSEHVDVMGNPYYHVSAPEQVGQSETKAVTVTDQTRTTQVAANDAPVQSQQPTNRSQAPDATTDDTTRRA